MGENETATTRAKFAVGTFAVYHEKLVRIIDVHPDAGGHYHYHIDYTHPTSTDERWRSGGSTFWWPEKDLQRVTDPADCLRVRRWHLQLAIAERHRLDVRDTAEIQAIARAQTILADAGLDAAKDKAQKENHHGSCK